MALLGRHAKEACPSVFLAASKASSAVWRTLQCSRHVLYARAVAGSCVRCCALWRSGTATHQFQPLFAQCARDWVCRVQGSCRTGHGMCMCVGPKHVQDCGAELLHACWGGMATPEASMGHVTHGSPPPRCAPGGPYRTTAPSTHGITTCGPKPTHLGCNCPQWPLQHARAGCCMQGAWN